MKDILFYKLAIVGVGLIGGSLAKASRSKGLVEKIIGFGRNTQRLKKAKELGIIDEYSIDFKKGLKGVDLVVVATPVGIIVDKIKEMIPYLEPNTIITDVGSVKEPIVREVERFLPTSLYFIGGHPIAGTEDSGFEASFSTLFEDHIQIMTPTKKTNKNALRRLERFWKAVGSKVILMDAKSHDYIFAAISHLPHMVAFSLVNSVVELKGIGEKAVRYSAGGFKDFTRIAASHPIMWRDIALMNKNNIIKTIEHFQLKLDYLKTTIKKDKAKELERFFTKSRKIRRKI